MKITAMSQPINQYVHANRQRFLDELKEFLRIPSVSTLPEHKPDIDRAAAFVANALGAAGIENVEIIPTAKHPLVYADWLHAPGKPTVLCYGHYDVQPPDPLELWNTPPFEPTDARREPLRARVRRRQGPDVHARQGGGSAARGERHAAGEPQIPGRGRGGDRRRIDREVRRSRIRRSSRPTWRWFQTPRCMPRAFPTLCIGLRGLIYTEIEATGPSRDLHSGLYGGAAPNAVFGLVELLAKAEGR